MYSKVQSVSSVATDLERLERNLRTNMSASVLDMLGHANRRNQ
jgi:conjugative transfer pilus assembly protein TraH